ncbi:aliphatic sulfonate ABC transporter substrate-binding protein [Cellulomonas dongxiuzhuiae]|uniref:Aliphatic sulfonate ABC transporter substrate-binding protein n=1 Tax=Cellulomonas dongxiuzhuiae TaxID=2819979 RepID=A0ABX8GM60_9CELL|nr:aliphatic sulfonate ABC transporter substrate-binding protein [Cellulomonas dongxiuzhuiae]MBO3095992.1 aliphatic sulfonate ABC transporter substrate-binding protein [Cellulomonas dongxiuzhuiae]QWC17279.1 aliphatic sulfonate ABC transporter substrate-binding protein [Cellulomonas dongxiuzhuiae]
MTIRTAVSATALALVTALALTGCVAGENAEPEAADPSAASDGEVTWSADTLDIDFATYNPLSLVIKDQGWLEETLGDDVTVNWVQSAGSNKANEALRAGAVDVGSTAGSAALLARSNGSPIHTIGIYSQPEWAAIVVPATSDITSVADLAGKSVAATKGTDPYFFLLQSLEEAGVPLDQVEVQNLQHADGRTALEQGSVAAWSGLDPIMAASEAESGTKLIYRNIDFNTYGFLNATQDFLDASPDLAQVVVDAYEKAREWAQENPEEVVAILAEVAGIDPAVAEKVIVERTNLGVDPVPGDAQREVLEVVGPIFVESGDVADQATIDKALAELFEPTFAEKADASTIAG